MSRRNRIFDNLGYVLVRVGLGHPLAHSNGYAYEHRLVLFEAGVEVPPEKVVHHRNGDPADNRLENLEVLTRAEHIAAHASPTCTVCGEDNWYRKPSNGHRTCRTCAREQKRRTRERLTALRLAGQMPDEVHGTSSGYTQWGCRCLVCLAKHRTYRGHAA